MSTYNNNRFTPGNKANMRAFLNKAFIRQYYRYFNSTQLNENINNGDGITEGDLCGCIQQRANKVQQGYNQPGLTNNMRISQLITSSLGGRVVFGNPNNRIDELGGWEGQPGGSFKPLRNKF